MDVVHTSKQFLQVFARCRLLQLLILDYEFEELASTGKLHHEVEIFVCFDYLIDLDNIWMVKLFKNLYLAADPLYVFFVLYF